MDSIDAAALISIVINTVSIVISTATIVFNIKQLNKLHELEREL